MNSGELQTLLDTTADSLGEHFSSLVILASSSDTDSIGHFTDGFVAGTGDFYARQGLAHAYLDKATAMRVVKLLKDEEKE